MKLFRGQLAAAKTYDLNMSFACLWKSPTFESAKCTITLKSKYVGGGEVAKWCHLRTMRWRGGEMMWNEMKLGARLSTMRWRGLGMKWDEVNGCMKLMKGNEMREWHAWMGERMNEVNESMRWHDTTWHDMQWDYISECMTWNQMKRANGWMECNGM